MGGNVTASIASTRAQRTGVHRSVQPTARRYRPDIQGLRAIAAGLVVLYHAGVPFLHGGYVGVDVFFVISGFLITRQLTGEVQRTGRLKLGAFYARRARRLLPPAAVVVVTTLLVGRLVLPYQQLKALTSDAIYAATYSINYHLALSGVQYQNASSAPSPLQHFWSLAAEEQYYLIWPVLIGVIALVVRARRIRTAITIMAVAAIVGVSVNLSRTITPVNHSVGYFSLQTRAWELGTGALVALSLPALARVPAWLSRLLSWAGLAAILASAVSFTDATVFPGVAACVPVAGAALVIAGGTHRNPWTVETVLLDQPPMQYIGRSSYAWYLWHWPMLILLPYWVGHPLGLPARLEIVALALWFAVLTYFLENAAHRSSWRTPAWLGAGLGLSAVMTTAAVATAASLPNLAGTGAVRYATVLTQADQQAVQRDIAASLSIDKLPRNLTPKLSAAPFDVAGMDCHTGELGTTSAECVLGDSKASHVAVLIGDSKAHQWAHALSIEAKKAHWKIIELTKAACPIADVHVWNADLKRPYTECDAFRTWMFDQVRALRPALIIASQSDTVPANIVTDSQWGTDTRTALGSLAGNYAHVVYIEDTPTTEVDTTSCLTQHINSVTKCAYKRQDAYGQFALRPVRLQHALTGGGIGYVNVVNWFCGPFYCPPVVDNMVVHRDWGHITDTYSLWLAPMLDPVFRGVAK